MSIGGQPQCDVEQSHIAAHRIGSQRRVPGEQSGPREEPHVECDPFTAAVRGYPGESHRSVVKRASRSMANGHIMVLRHLCNERPTFGHHAMVRGLDGPDTGRTELPRFRGGSFSRSKPQPSTEPSTVLVGHIAAISELACREQHGSVRS